MRDNTTMTIGTPDGMKIEADSETLKKAAARLNRNTKVKAYADRVNALKEEQKQLGEDIRSVFKEAENAGINPKALKEAMRRARMDKGLVETADQYEMEL